MTNPFEEAKYLPLPALSPYTGHGRYENPPKEIFKAVEKKLREVTEPERSYRFGDIACGNAEMMYYLRSQFPSWQFTGYDLTPEFIETARSYPGLSGVELHVSDLYDVTERFEIVTCVNLMSAIWEPEPFLDKLLSLVEPGGVLIVEGLFNEYDVEVRAVFMDNSKPESKGLWRREGSQHSQATIAGLLEGRCERFGFEPVPMGVEIPRREDAPATDVWTFKDEHGRNLITNGSHIIFQKWLLTVQTAT